MARKAAPGLTVSMDILVDEDEVDAALQALWWAVSGESLRRFHILATSPFLRQRAKERFENEGDSTVGKWEQLTDSRQEIREHAGFPAAHPINHATGQLERYILTGKDDITFGAGWAAFYLPRNTGSPRLLGKMERAQLGAPAGHPMPVGGRSGGTKPSPSATPARPVVGMDMTDLVHLTGALEIFIAGEVGREIR